jgi:two-component system OmpR family response regulator
MPGLDGIDTLREIKRKKPLIEVILLTGHASMESGIEGIKLGAYDYVMKPANLEELIEKMRQAYEKKVVFEAQALEGR